eukprot:SAG22_NODE_86_length_21440_cov_288.248700_21_plen_121_part_00
MLSRTARKGAVLYRKTVEAQQKGSALVQLTCRLLCFHSHSSTSISSKTRPAVSHGISTLPPACSVLTALCSSSRSRSFRLVLSAYCALYASVISSAGRSATFSSTVPSSIRSRILLQSTA